MSTIENIENSIIRINKLNKQQVPDYIIDVIKNSNGMTPNYYQGLLQSLEHNIQEYHDSMSLELLRFSHLPIAWPPKTANALDVNIQLFARAAATKCLAQDGIAIYMKLDAEKKLRLSMEDLKGRITPLLRIEGATFYQGDSIDESTENTHPVQGYIIDKNIKIMSFVPELISNRLQRSLQNTIWLVGQVNHEHKIHEMDSVKINNNSVVPILCNGYSPRIHEQLRRRDSVLVDYLANTAAYGPTQKTIRKIVYDSLLAQASSDPSTRSQIVIEALRQHLDGKTWFLPSRLAERSTLPQINNAATLDDSVFEFATQAIVASGVMLNPKVKTKRMHQSISPSAISEKSPKRAPASLPYRGEQGPKPFAQTPSDATHITNKHTDELSRICQVFDSQKGKVEQISLTSLLINEITDGALLPFTLEEINALNGIVSGMIQFPNQRDIGASWLSNIIHERQLALLQRQEVKPHDPEEKHQSSRPKIS